MFYDNDNSENQENIVKILIFGVGGGGCNAINRLVKAKVQGVTFIASNTDMLALNKCDADIKIQLGKKRTHGLGAGSKPQVGKEAAEESIEEIKASIAGANLIFLTAGMGGGTGTGATPVVAAAARELGILTIGIVTKPFASEGRLKMQYAEAGIEELKKYTDVLLVIPNQKVFDYVKQNSLNKKEDGAMLKLMQIADDVLHSSIVGITNLIVKHSLINLDFADLCTVIKGKGTAHIGVGQAEGDKKVEKALIQAARSPLLESNFAGATQLIVSITGDVGMTAMEITDAMELISQVVSPDCNIIQGIGFDDTLEDKAMVTIVATGFDAKPADKPIFDETEESATPHIVEKEEVMPAEPEIPSYSPLAAFDKPSEQISDSADNKDEKIPNFLRRLRERGNK